jgi:hypothetical protein
LYGQTEEDVSPTRRKESGGKRKIYDQDEKGATSNVSRPKGDSGNESF